MSVSLAPMSEARLRPWFEAGQAEYADDLTRAGMTRSRAIAKVRDSFETYFPGGVPAPGHLVFDVLSGTAPVGYVWIGPRSDGNPDEWWLWDIAIAEAHRRQGFGRAAVRLAEAEARARGATTFGLNVFGFNAAARALYDSLGYEVVTLQMVKRLT